MKQNLFSKPKLQQNQNQEKSATWIELFYDLAYVAAISVAGHYLSGNFSLKGIMIFLFMFVSIWILWVSGAYYANWFEINDIVYRISIIFQITGIVGLAVFSHDIMEHHNIEGFIISYIIVRLTGVYNYIRAAKFNKSIRLTVVLYTIGHGFAFIFWIAALFLNVKYKFYILVPALLIDYITPLLNMLTKKNVKIDVKHLLERFGLLTIIVFGEIIIAIVNGVTDSRNEEFGLVYGFLGVLIVFLMWWIYFNAIEKFIDHFKVQFEKVKVIDKKVKYIVYLRNYFLMYGHLGLQIGLIVCSFGLKKLIKYNSISETYKFLYYGLFITFLFLGLMEINAKHGRERKQRYTQAVLKIISSFIFLVFCFINNFKNIYSLILIIIVCIISIITDIMFLIKENKQKNKNM